MERSLFFGSDRSSFQFQCSSFTNICCWYCPIYILLTPWTVAHWAPLSMGFPRQESWRGLPCPPPGDLPHPGIEPVHPASQVDSLTLSQQGSPCMYLINTTSILKYQNVQKQNKTKQITLQTLTRSRDPPFSRCTCTYFQMPSYKFEYHVFKVSYTVTISEHIPKYLYDFWRSQ